MTLTLVDEQVLQAMESIGGSFAQAIALAARRADPENFITLKTAMADLWSEYEEIVALKQRNRASR